MTAFEISQEELERLLEILEERKVAWFMRLSLKQCLDADLRRFDIVKTDTEPGIKAFSQETSDGFYFAHADASQFLSEENLRKFIVHFL